MASLFILSLFLILWVGYRAKFPELLQFFFLIAALIPLLGGTVSGQTNEKLAEGLVENNWQRIEKRVKMDKNDSLILFQAGEPSPMARYFFSSLNSILLRDGFKNIFFENKKITNGFRIEIYLKKFSIHYFPIKTRLFRRKKFRRMVELVQNIQVIAIGNGKVLWSGDLTSTAEDTLRQKAVLECQKNQLPFLRGKVERTKEAFYTYLKMSFLAGISIGVMVLFFLIRST